jgi:hypothetical protein
MDINQLTIKELEILGNAVHDRMIQIRRQQEDELKRKDSVKNKTKLCQLTSSDRIFKIEIYQNNITNKMTINTDYVDVVGVRNDLEGYSYNFGGSSSWFSVVTGEKHYHLDNGCGKYSFKFYTLKPETWIEDLNEARKYIVEIRKERFENELSSFKESLSKFDELKENIISEVNKIINQDKQ